MTNFLNHIAIDNFKSVRKLEINNFSRINLFIGRPNVGKSNIIEALSLFSIPYLRENTSKKLSNLVRLENESELFYNGNIDRDSFIKTNVGDCKLAYNPKEGLEIIVDYLGNSCKYLVDDKLNVKGGFKREWLEPPIKKYVFKPDIVYKKSHSKYLTPPFGFNLLGIIENYEELKKQVQGLFKENNLEIAFDKGSQTIKVIQTNKDGIFLIPYNSIADTLQRIIFYKSAIASNNNSILLFEEPEAHSFPPYMTHLTQEMIYKKDDQFFIATHSPFILNDLLENSRSELSVFIVNYDNHETKVRNLSDEELHNAFQSGVDFFTNNESFV